MSGDGDDAASGCLLIFLFIAWLAATLGGLAYQRRIVDQNDEIITLIRESEEK